MNEQDEIIEMARQVGIKYRALSDEFATDNGDGVEIEQMQAFAKLVAEKEREALEAELLKLKKGIASNSDYIQGRWDLIGKFQDVIRARGQA
jgi:hypothetical protein